MKGKEISMKDTTTKIDLYIGIDLGANGGIAFITRDKSDYSAWDMVNNAKNILKIMNQFLSPYANNDYSNVKVVLEAVHGRSEQGSINAFTFGVNCARIYSVLEIIDIPYTKISAVSWQKGLGLVLSQRRIDELKSNKSALKTERKNLYLKFAKENFPDIKPTKKTADALCLAEYMRRKEISTLF